MHGAATGSAVRVHPDSVVVVVVVVDVVVVVIVDVVVCLYRDSLHRSVAKRRN